MIRKETLKVGDKVCYQPFSYEEREWQNGIVKEIPPDSDERVRVVYNLNGDDYLEHYKDRPSEWTYLEDLHLGWKCGRNDMKNKFVECKTSCYKCKYKRNVPGQSHIKCINPDPDMTGDSFGKQNGWFIYPSLFDPIWRTKECKNFEEK